ncbi:MAG: RNA methyltransferase, partial [Sinomicrobium sp.]|nr:RNA methyltransferase [Sinomicrobium sp.]
MKRIESLQNPLVKHILQLREKSRLRKKTGLFVIEGVRELSLALKGGYPVTTVLLQPDIIPPDAAGLLKQMDPGTEIVEIPKTVYRKLACRGTTEGVLAIGRTKETALSGLRFGRDNPLILVAEAPEKPGNIGALLRTADAAGLDAVIIANPRTDLFNPNIIRASLGCVFTVAVATGSTREII